MAKFSVGDVVVGNSRASNHYSITQTGWVGTVRDVSGNNIHVFSQNDAGNYWVEAEYFDLVEQQNPVEESDFLQML